MKKLPDNQIAFYQAPDGSVNIEIARQTTIEEFSVVQAKRLNRDSLD